MLQVFLTKSHPIQHCLKPDILKEGGLFCMYIEVLFDVYCVKKLSAQDQVLTFFQLKETC